MRILVFSYWSLHDGITRGTIFQLIEAMAKNQSIETIVFCTVEARNFMPVDIDLPKTIHVPVRSGVQSVIDKMWDYVRLPFVLKGLIRRHAINLLWCKGAPAGGVGTLVHLLTGVPYAVDSFEPHSSYMRHSGTWSQFNWKYVIQNFMERLTSRNATALLPVSEKYRDVIVNSGRDKQSIFVLPCVVDVSKFAFDATTRASVRKDLGLAEDCIAGVYVGKYGGLYYDEEAFRLYQRLFIYFGVRFFLIIITEADASAIRGSLAQLHLPLDRVFVSKVDHAQVPAYLSAADFAISTIKSVAAMRFCSPIKHGEYWAADLPILSTLSIGDDAEIIEREGGGVILDISDAQSESEFQKLEQLMRVRSTGKFSGLARRYRHQSILKDAIEFVLCKSRLP